MNLKGIPFGRNQSALRQNLPNYIRERVKVRRLSEARRNTERLRATRTISAPAAITHITGTSGAMALPPPLEKKREAVHSRHHQVKQDHTRLALAQT